MLPEYLITLLYHPSPYLAGVAIWLSFVSVGPPSDGPQTLTLSMHPTMSPHRHGDSSAGSGTFAHTHTHTYACTHERNTANLRTHCLFRASLRSVLALSPSSLPPAQSLWISRHMFTIKTGRCCVPAPSLYCCPAAAANMGRPAKRLRKNIVKR